MKPRLRRRKGAALVLTLLVVIIMTTITVALFVAMRMERSSASHYIGRTHAGFMAQEAVQVACNLLSDSFRQTNGTASMPGRLYTNVSGTNWLPVELSSGAAAGYNASARTVTSAADLNRAVRSADNLPLIDPTGGPMPVNWIYVLKDGTRAATLPSPLSTNNPVIGRYAYWVDDESARVNLNTAWKSGNTNTLAHPSQIPLAGVISNIGTAAGTTAGVFSTSQLQTVQEAALRLPGGAGISNTVSSNRYYLTTYNHSSALNPWGEPKIYLTTQLSNIPPQFAALPARTTAVSPPLGQCRSDYYLDILATDNNDPGRNTTNSNGTSSAINFSKVNIQLNRLVDLLSRTNWPGQPAESFAQKFLGNAGQDTNRIAQLALDIIDYVRSAETTNVAVPAIRASPTNGTFTLGSDGDDDYIGTARHPVITEMGVWISATTTNIGATNVFQAQVKTEVYCPPNYQLGNNFPLTNNRLLIQLAGSTVFTNAIQSSWTTAWNGNYAVITTPVFNAVNGSNVPISWPTRTNNIKLRVVLENSKEDVWEAAPKDRAIVPVDGTNVSVDSISTSEVDDPRVNKSPNDWKNLSGANTLGSQNSIWKGATSRNTRLPQDFDADGTTFSDSSLTMPAPKGTAGNPNGLVRSVAELGRIPTGINSTTNNNGSSVNWRTVRLQPGAAGDTNIADWSLLDLFSAPIKADTNKIYFPTTSSIAGRVNINELVQPFGTNYKQPVFTALAAGASLSATALANIRNHTLAANGRSFGSTNFYKSPGELAEIAGVADAGEASETNLLPIVNLATTCSDVFRVYATGQTLVQTPSGQLVIEASKSVEAVVERQGTASGTVFVPVFWSETSF